MPQLTPPLQPNPTVTRCSATLAFQRCGSSTATRFGRRGNARAAGKASGPVIEPRATGSQQIHGHEDVAVIKERTPQPGHAINLLAVPCWGNKEESWRARDAAGPTREVRVTPAHR
jgi:hypothetical protein